MEEKIPNADMKPAKSARISESRTKKIVMIAMLCAIAYVMVLVFRIPVVLFLKYEPKDVVIALGGLIWGPLTSFVISVIVSFIEMVTVSETGYWGLIMNILASCSFACTAAFIYKKKHSIGGAVCGLAAGVAVTVVVMLLWNYLITPIYMGQPREAIADLLLPAFLPFNLLKAGLNASFTFLLYKPLMTALRKTGIVGTVDSGKTDKRKKMSLGFILLACAVIITCVLVILSMRKII